VNPEIVKKARAYLGRIPKHFDIQYQNLHSNLKDDWKGKRVWIGYPGTSMLEPTVRKLKLKRFKTAYVVIPEVSFEKWYQQLEGIRSTSWFGVEPHDEDGNKFWVDSEGRPHADPPITWWIVKIVGSG
jgi:hypothetical protein